MKQLIESYNVPGVGHCRIEHELGVYRYYIQGCYCGQVATVPGARARLFEHCRDRLKVKLDRAHSEVRDTEQNLGALLKDPTLAHFKK